MFVCFIPLIQSCSSPTFKNKIENENNDIIKDESFMRFNSSRIDAYNKKSLNEISKSVAACHEEKFKKGKDALEIRMQQEKTNPFYWNALGTCYYLNDEIPKALFYFELATESLSKYKNRDKLIAEASIENNIGLIHLKYKRYNEAYDSFKKANLLVPNMLTPKINLAQIELEFNHNDKVISLLKQVDDTSNGINDTDVLYSLSLAYFRNHDYENSYKSISRIEKDYLNRPDVVGLYALNLIKKNRLIEAKAILEKRIIAYEFESRNKIILDNVNDLIKSNDKKLDTQPVLNKTI